MSNVGKGTKFYYCPDCNEVYEVTNKYFQCIELEHKLKVPVSAEQLIKWLNDNKKPLKIRKKGDKVGG